MRQQIERLKSDPDAIEREAREKLHYAKPGEVIYTLPDADGRRSRATNKSRFHSAVFLRRSALSLRDAFGRNLNAGDARTASTPD